jgi:hypothetical protein
MVFETLVNAYLGELLKSLGNFTSPKKNAVYTKMKRGIFVHPPLECLLKRTFQNDVGNEPSKKNCPIICELDCTHALPLG